MEKKNIILALLLFLVIGFAAVTTTLYINGTISFAPNEDDFVIIFTYARLDGVDVSEEVISEDGQTITYTTNELSKVGDRSQLYFEVTNTSTMYDAEIEMDCKAEGAHSNYYSIDYWGLDYVYANSDESGYVYVYLDKVSTGVIEETFTCTITAKAVEREYDTSYYTVSGFIQYLTDDGYYSLAAGTFMFLDQDIIVEGEDWYPQFTLYGFPDGEHEVYYMGEMTTEEIENMIDEEIKEAAIASTTFVTEELSGQECAYIQLTDEYRLYLYDPNKDSCANER